MSNDIKALKSPWEILHPLKGNVVFFTKLIKLNKAANAATALEGYLPYVNNVAEIGNTMDAAAMQPGIRLLGNRRGHYELEWTTPQYWQYE